MDAAPDRLGLFIFDCVTSRQLADTLSRIPAPVRARLKEIVVVQGVDSSLEPDGVRQAESRCGVPLRLHRQPALRGRGGDRKEAFEYALGAGFDWVIAMRGDGTHPCESMPALIDAAHREAAPVVLGVRNRSRATARAGPSPVWRRGGRRLLLGLVNRLLGLRLGDHGTSFRMYAVDVLRSLPFQLNADDALFDTHILIQCRALGVGIREVILPETWSEERSLAAGARSALAALDYRLHQLHLVRRGRYFVDHGIHYTLKKSRTSSHMQIVELIAPDSRVLDLGCSQGLLAGPLSEKGVRVTGVDSLPEDRRTSPALQAYFRRDLEEPLEIPTGRDFDFVVVADVIEHVRERAQLLRSVRRYLRADGRLLISTPNIALWFYRLSLLVGRFEYGPRGVLDFTHVHLYTRDSFRREIESAGFRIVGERVTALPFEIVFESTGRSRLVRALGRGYHQLARLWPGMFAYQILLEAVITTLDEEAAAPLGRPGQP